MFTVNRNGSEKSDCKINLSSSNEINNILLVGNGFDLALGLKTSYSDFLKFICVKVYLINSFSELKISKEYREFVKRSLQNYFYEKKDDGNKCNQLNEDKILQIYYKAIDEIEDPNNMFFKEAESLKDKLDLPFISDFFILVLGEEIIKIIRGKTFYLNKLRIEQSVEYQEVKRGFKKRFDNKQIGNDNSQASTEEQLFDATHDIEVFLRILNNKIKQATVKQWVDVESFIEFLATNDRKLCSKFYPKKKERNSPLFDDPSKEKEYCKGLEVFCNLFKEYLNDVLEPNFVNFNYIDKEYYLDILKDIFNVDSLVMPYYDNLELRSDGFLKKINPNKVTHIITFNYTYTTEVIFRNRYNKDMVTNSYHVNGEIDYANHHKITDQSNISNNIVFGFSNTKAQNIKSTLHAFEKKVLRVIKNTSPLNLDKLTSPPFNLLIYGHSCGVADSDVIGKLLKSSKLQIAVILCYDQDSLVSITNNLIEIVGQDRFDELLNNANNKTGKESLYFAVRNELLGTHVNSINNK